MNKKFLSVVLFGALMAGSSVTFTGCIDNDEPAGITDLRGAKAELLRAKVAVEAANAARENANAALILAQAEVQKAQAVYWNAQAAQEQAKADSLAALSDAERAKADSTIADCKQKMEEAALRHDTAMVNLQKELAMANRQYELALKQIEIAKATMSDSDTLKLKDLEDALETAQGNVTKAAKSVEAVEDQVYEIMLLKAQGLAVDSVKDKINKVVIAALEKAVERDSIALVGAQYELDRLNEYAEKDPKVANWVAEIKELDDSISRLDNLVKGYDVELAKFNNSQEVLDAKKAKDDAAVESERLAEFVEDPALIEIAAYSYTYKFEANQPGAGPADGGDLGHVGYGRNEFKLPSNDASSLDDVKTELAWVKVERAKYTAERINRLEKIATDGISDDKEAYDKTVKAWKEAKEKYDNAPTDAAFAKVTETAEKAINVYTTTIANIDANTALTAEQKASQKLVAANTLAAALVTYYTEGAKLNLVTNEVTLPTYNPTTGVQTGTAHKTVLAWLSEASYGGSNLQAILNNDSRTTDFFLAVEGTPASAENATTGAVKAKDSKAQLLSKLQNASDTAFGKAMLVKFGGENGYMLVEPTEADVLAWINDGEVSVSNLGKAGEYYDAKQAESTQEYKNYKEWIADLDLAIPSLEAEVKLIEDAIEAAKVAADAAKVAADKAEADYDAMIEAGTKELEATKLLTEAKQKATENVRKALLSALGTYSEVTGSFTNLDDFTEALKEKITTAEDKLYGKDSEVGAIQKLAESRVALQMVLDGRHDAEAMAREQLDKEMTRLEAAQKAYETALKNLEIALKIMAGESSAE